MIEVAEISSSPSTSPLTVLCAPHHCLSLPSPATRFSVFGIQPTPDYSGWILVGQSQNKNPSRNLGYRNNVEKRKNELFISLIRHLYIILNVLLGLCVFGNSTTVHTNKQINCEPRQFTNQNTTTNKNRKLLSLIQYVFKSLNNNYNPVC